MKTALIVCILLFIVLPTRADILNVPQNYLTIQNAIDAAQNGDTVLVAQGTYYENINFKGKAITVASHFVLGQDTSYRSKTIIDGSKHSDPDSGSVVYFISGEDTSSVLCGFTVTGGTGTLIPYPVAPVPLRLGGGIFCYMSGAHIKNNIIIGNQCINNLADVHAGGGGISVSPPGFNSFVIIEMNEIINNLAWSQGNATTWYDAWAQGGGIALFTNGLVKGNDISLNQCKSVNGVSVGGGIRLMGGTVTILNNRIVQNSSVSSSSTGFAGGISCSAANANIESNSITHNSVAGVPDCHGNAIYFDLNNDANWAVVKNNFISANYYTNGTCYGGAIGMYTSSPDIHNNIITNNSADHGGALHVFNNSKPIIVNNTITGNTATQAGGALYAEDLTTDVFLMNSIFCNNSANGTNNEIGTNNGSTISIMYCDIDGGWEGEGNIDVNPLFTDSLFHLSDSSRCIGAGIASYNFSGTVFNAPEYDFDGNIRPHPADSHPDIGAMESERAYPLLPVIQIPDDYPTIQAGIDAASDGDTVLVAEGTYLENINFKGKAITVASHYILEQDTSHISTTIIDGSTHSDPDSGSVVYMISGEDTTSVLMGFTITGGSGTNITISDQGMNFDSRVGGGIYIASEKGSRISWNIIENNIISTDDLPFGGGISAGEPPLSTYNIIENNSIRNNWVSGGIGYTQGGGIFFASNGRICNNIISGNIASGVNSIAVGGAIRLLCPEADYGARFCLIEENVIRDNQAVSDNNDSFGGAVMSAGIRITLRSNKIISNIAKGHKDYSGGGGLYIGSLIDGHHLIEGNLFIGNKLDGAYYGGGIALYNSSPVIINNIFSGNTARYGGGLFLDNTSIAEVVNNTFDGNSASNQGGGIYSRNSTLNVMNTIIWNNTAPSGAQIYRTGGSENVAYSDIQEGGNENGNINVDPIFKDPLFHLSATSPCIDAGNPDLIYDDIEELDNPGYAQYPSEGTTRNDMGAYGGPYTERIVPVKVEKQRDESQPSAYTLSQNYPNPFNPVTVISWQLAVASQVDLSVYNILGQKVATLVSEKQPAGLYSVDWDASGFTSGIYFYRLQTNGGFVQTRKLMLIK